jgi:pimeloyl-ACP methyl ester carboxylesterase
MSLPRGVPRITGVTAPVLVLRGANDPVATSRWCRRLAGRAAMGRLLEIQGTGHVVQHNRAVEVAEAVTTFAGLSSEMPQEFMA